MLTLDGRFAEAAIFDPASGAHRARFDVEDLARISTTGGFLRENGMKVHFDVRGEALIFSIDGSDVEWPADAADAERILGTKLQG